MTDQPPIEIVALVVPSGCGESGQCPGAVFEPRDDVRGRQAVDPAR